MVLHPGTPKWGPRPSSALGAQRPFGAWGEFLLSPIDRGLCVAKKAFKKDHKGENKAD